MSSSTVLTVFAALVASANGLLWLQWGVRKCSFFDFFLLLRRVKRLLRNDADSKRHRRQAYLKEVGVGMLLRKMAANIKPTLDIKIEGDEWTMTSTSSFKTHAVKFKLGQEFDDKTADGRDVLSKFTVENDKLVQKETGKNGGKDSTILRFVEGGNKLSVTCECNGVKSVRTYEKAA
ncbi:unnamed protein product [Caenorhabditis auriculariae]|uniref:Lipocalin/cytosolic fatty-acid binding domain-containing protein n=1 Tax=Caenorhabditis auriculariae TaxID=2777116 RepID=A0A8S1HEZ5_9PELO|nr:unnamed protein product [Caenorhabditis auriculariae]